jgi:hypothetical protein
MMDQLGIKRLRPGPSGNEKDPNHANYDEATANPYPNFPDVLTLKNGKKVTSAKMFPGRAGRPPATPPANADPRAIEQLIAYGGSSNDHSE